MSALGVSVAEVKSRIEWHENKVDNDFILSYPSINHRNSMIVLKFASWEIALDHAVKVAKESVSQHEFVTLIHHNRIMAQIRGLC